MIVSVHVYRDGDIELTRHSNKPAEHKDLVFEDVEVLRKELSSYGAEEDRISEALTVLETETTTIV